MADSIERIADEIMWLVQIGPTADWRPNMAEIATRLRALSPAGGDVWEVEAGGSAEHPQYWLHRNGRTFFNFGYGEDAELLAKSMARALNRIAASPQQEPGAVVGCAADLDNVKGPTLANREEVPHGLLDRIKAAEQRIADGHAPRRIPAEVTDVDLVLAEVRAWIEGKHPQFWIAPADESGASGQTLAGAGGTLVAGSRGKYLYLPGVSIKSAAPPKSGAVPFDVLSIASEMEAACPHYAGPDVDYSVDASKVHTWAQALRATQPATSAGTTGDDSEDAALPDLSEQMQDFLRVHPFGYSHALGLLNEYARAARRARGEG